MLKLIAHLLGLINTSKCCKMWKFVLVLYVREWSWSSSILVVVRLWTGGRGNSILLLAMGLEILFTYSIKCSPSWKCHRFSASQEIHRILRKPNVHYLIHKCLTSFPFLNQIKQITVQLSGLCEQFVTWYGFTVRIY